MDWYKKLLHFIFPYKDTKPARAYNLWSSEYDNQPENLMLSLDNVLFDTLLKKVDTNNKQIIDVGCGTGRHWLTIYARGVKSIIGYDVSQGMLRILKQKFPGCVAWKINNNKLLYTADNYADILISTLTIAHINNAQDAMKEWNRALKPGGYIIITDYHPLALKKGGKRTFSHKGRTVSVMNNIHSIENIKEIASIFNWQTVYFEERLIDDALKPVYEKQNALRIYESFKGTPIIYGIIFRKDGF